MQVKLQKRPFCIQEAWRKIQEQVTACGGNGAGAFNYQWLSKNPDVFRRKINDINVSSLEFILPH